MNNINKYLRIDNNNKLLIVDSNKKDQDLINTMNLNSVLSSEKAVLQNKIDIFHGGNVQIINDTISNIKTIGDSLKEKDIKCDILNVS